MGERPLLEDLQNIHDAMETLKYYESRVWVKMLSFIGFFLGHFLGGMFWLAGAVFCYTTFFKGTF
jgi:hypothetical protein